MKILTINDKNEEKFLRIKTANFDFAKFSRKEIADLIKKMKESILEANGVGLSANQIGLNLRMFIALILEKPPKRDEKNKIIMPSPDEAKFYAIFNPEIVKFSEQTEIIEEGCLSVPGIYGEVKRPTKITVAYFDKNGRKNKIKTEGLTARVFQHETDHLNGILFIDKTKKLHKILKNNQ